MGDMEHNPRVSSDPGGDFVIPLASKRKTSPKRKRLTGKLPLS